MTAKHRKSKASGERRQRRFKLWESDRASPSSASSLDVLMEWLTTPGNALRWHQASSRKGLCQEVLRALEARGIAGRALGDVDTKVRVLEKQFVNASAFLGLKGKKEAFKRGEADEETVKNVLRLCPQYRELLTVFGQIPTGREAQVEAAVATKKGVAAQQHKTMEKEAGDRSAAGKWKESLEKNRPRTSSGEQVGEVALQSVKKASGGGAVDGQKRDGSAAEKGSEAGAGQQRSADGMRAKSTGEDEGADVESEDEPRTQVHVESEDDSSEEEPEERQAPAVRNKVLKTKKQHESETSSSEDESHSSQGESDDSDEEEDADGEDRIPLAQPDEEQEQEDKLERETKDGESAINDEDGEDDDVEPVEEKENTENEEEGDVIGEEDEEEGQEEKEADVAKAHASSDDSDSSSNQSENEDEDEDNETEVGPTSKTAVNTDSGHEEPQHDFEHDDEMEDADQKPAELSESEAETFVQPPISRKRSAAKTPAPRTKRYRSDSNATRGLERETYVERAKQEQAQRQELFQLERAKLECELEAKRVQLALEKTLARKKLLGAGVDLAEVDRVLPL